MIVLKPTFCLHIEDMLALQDEHNPEWMGAKQCPPASNSLTSSSQNVDASPDSNLQHSQVPRA
jgi:hypothetical protein